MNKYYAKKNKYKHILLLILQQHQQQQQNVNYLIYFKNLFKKKN